MDDCLKFAITFIQDLSMLCKKGGFTFCAKEVKDLDLDQDKLPVERVLVLHWCIESDALKFKMVTKDKPLTRRGIPSMVNSIYDPLRILFN